jgi:hypothetical protein
MLDWSPWTIMLRQQALLAQVFSRMIEAQQQFAPFGKSSARPSGWAVRSTIGVAHSSLAWCVGDCSRRSDNLASVVRLLARNLPLVLLLVMVGALFWPIEPQGPQQPGETDETEGEEDLSPPTR